jgi:hypothetical protein
LGAAGKVSVDWNKTIRVNRTHPSLQVTVSPLLARGAPTHDQAWSALRDLQADYVRFQSWFSYPKLAVAELEPPANGRTSWDFSLIDPYLIDFLEATQGHPVIVNFSEAPAWMFKTEKPVRYPADPHELTWDYTQGVELRDPSMKELADYFARFVSWYTKGGFTDEFGKWHESGHHYEWDYWEVFNEPDLTRAHTPESYTARYDAIVTAIRPVQPHMKFVGLSLGLPAEAPQFFEYFLDARNHQPGIPLDMISYHFYALPIGIPFLAWEYTVFDQSAQFVNIVRYIETIRQRLAPQTLTAINEVGIIHPDDLQQGKPDYKYKPFPNAYWNLCAAQFAYLYGELARLGIEMLGQSALIQPPRFFVSVSLMDWETGKPNARYWVLKLLIESFKPGDRLVQTTAPNADIFAQGFLAKDGKRRILLVNKRNRPVEVDVPGTEGSRQAFIDETTGSGPPANGEVKGETLGLRGFAVHVVTLP